MVDKLRQKLLFTRRELAAAVSVHRGTITKWEAAGMPVEVRGGRGVASLYYLPDVLQWLKDRDAPKSADGEGKVVDLTAERARKERAQAVLAEQRFAERAGRLLDAEDVRRVWSGEVAAVRRKLLAYPEIVAAKIAPAAKGGERARVVKVLTEATHEALAELAAGDLDPPTKARKKSPRARKRAG